LRQSLEKLEAAGAQLLAVDPHEKWAGKFLLKETGLETTDLNYPLLLDPSLTVSAAYGVAFGMRIHVEHSNRPATFIIDRDGVLQYAKRATNFNDRPTPEQIVARLKELSR